MADHVPSVDMAGDQIAYSEDYRKAYCKAYRKAYCKGFSKFFLLGFVKGAVSGAASEALRTGNPIVDNTVGKITDKVADGMLYGPNQGTKRRKLTRICMDLVMPFAGAGTGRPSRKEG
jgi:hypothetical protein